MRIAIVTNNLVRGEGQGRVNYEVGLEAVRRGHGLTVLASSIDPGLQQHPLVEYVRIPVGGLPTQLAADIAFAWRSERWLRRHRQEFDILKANGGIIFGDHDLNAVHFVHSAWLKSPVHTSRVKRGPYAWYHRAYSEINAVWERKAFRQARCVVAVSEMVKDQLIAAGVEAGKIRVIPNGVDPEEFTPGSVDRRALGLPEGVPLGLFVGDIRIPLKNPDTILQALVRLPDVHLAIAGSVEGSPFPAEAARLGLEHRVHFLGFRRDVPQLMRAADFFLLPSRYESFSLVLLEAMSTGIPVVTAAPVGAAYLVTPESGFVISDPNSVDELSAAMDKLASDPELRRSMGRAARQVAEENSFATMATRYVDLMEELYGREPRQAARTPELSPSLA